MSIFRKIGRILLLVGGILELLGMAFYFLLMIGAFVVAGLVGAEVIPLDPPMAGIAGGIAGGVVFLFAAVISLIAGVVGIKGFKANTKGNYIANIVFGVLAFDIFLLAGGVLGLIALKKEKPAEEPVEEAQPAEEAK